MEKLQESVSTGQAARLLDLSTDRVVQLCEAGDLAFVRTSLGRLIDASSVERLREQRAERRRRSGESRTECQDQRGRAAPVDSGAG